MASSLAKDYGMDYVLNHMTYSEAVIIQQFRDWEGLEMEKNMPKGR